MVVLHGAPQAVDDLAGLAKALSARYRVSCVHLPGYGRTPPWAGSRYDIEAVGGEIVRTLERAGIRRPSLVGMSGGSYRALQIALDHPGAGIRALALLGALADLDEENRQALRGFGQALEAGVDITEPCVPRLFSPRHASAHPREAREIVAAMLQAPARSGVAAELNAFAESADLRPRLGSIAVPVYLRVGELDVATPVACSEEIHRAIPSSRLDVVPGCGHLIHHEDRENTIAAIAAFLDAVHAPDRSGGTS